MVCLFVGLTTRASIPEETIQTTVTAIQAKGGTDKQLVEAGVRQVARLWQSDDGNTNDFQSFCIKNYLTDPVTTGF